MAQLDDENEGDGILTVSDLKSNKGITIIHWNTRSLYPKLEEIVQINDNSQADVCIYTESWLTDCIPDGMIELDGYNLFRHDRDTTLGKQRGGGIVAYAKKHLDIIKHEKACVMTGQVEVMTLKLNLKQVREIYIMAVYRPPGSNVKEFIQIMENTILGLSDRVNIEVNLVGDVNIDLKKRNPNVKAYKDFLKRYDLCNMIKHETHYNGPVSDGSIIDHFVTNNPDLYQQAGICPTDESDHYIIFASRKKFKVETETRLLRARRYKSLVEEKFVEDLDKHSWDHILDCHDPSEAWDMFVEDFNEILDRHAPWKWMHVSVDLPDWATREFLSICRTRDHLKQKAIRIKNGHDIVTARRARIRARSSKET